MFWPAATHRSISNFTGPVNHLISGRCSERAGRGGGGGGGEEPEARRRRRRRSHVSFYLGLICFNCWVWVAGRRADVFRHNHVCISPCFVSVIDTLLFRLALGAEKKKKKKRLFKTMLLVHFFHWTTWGKKTRRLFPCQRK